LIEHFLSITVCKPPFVQIILNKRTGIRGEKGENRVWVGERQRKNGAQDMAMAEKFLK
jgi:hypothetical protein